MNSREYQRQWRADHPGYSREWNRAHGRYSERARRVSILGILVKPVWMPIPAISKERADEEFLRLTDDMKVR